jgi:hypothetical protein
LRIAARVPWRVFIRHFLPSALGVSADSSWSGVSARRLGTGQLLQKISVSLLKRHMRFGVDVTFCYIKQLIRRSAVYFGWTALLKI